jgi:proline dehydrogenase
MSLLDSLVARSLPFIPQAVVWKVARRYIAGLTLDDAARVIGELKERGLRATVDYLGEGVRRAEEAQRARQAYCEVLERIHADSLPAGISVKLSQLGLRIDRELAHSNLESLVTLAAGLRRFVRIDMEDSTTTDASIAIYRSLRARHQNLGMVLQAYLRRTLDDARALAPLRPDVRICKGIYAEPPGIAFQDRREVQRSFLQVAELLLEKGGRVAVATHDPYLIEEGLRLTEGLGPERHEFQMLLGVGRDLWEKVTGRGRRLRIYVPFGREWYPYSLRRLRENPRIAGYVFRDLLKPR